MMRGDDRITLIKIGGWEVRVDYRVDNDLWAAHVTCKGVDTGVCKMRYSWFTTDNKYGDTAALCCFCTEPVPPEIQALIRLTKGEMGCDRQ
jgi:hypothetical protein